MDTLGPENESTHSGHLADWQSFCLAYYEPILRTLSFLRVPEEQVRELAHTFLLKAAEKNFLETFRVFQEREELAGRRARFRTYLYRSLQNHVKDGCRKRATQPREYGMGRDEAESLASGFDRNLDPDALYALDILHQALQALRRHCERTGRPHYWVFFEETLLAEEFRGRRGKTRAELIQAFASEDPQEFDNAMTTAKRAFRRFVQEVIPRGLRDAASPAERFEEWMEILRQSCTSQFNLLHLAYRVTPFLSPHGSKSDSAALIVDTHSAGIPVGTYEEPALVPSDDEMSIFLSFRLELPLTEMLDAAELQQYIPPSNPLWPISRDRSRPARPISLLTLLDPTPDESEAFGKTDLVGLLSRLKLFAKQLRHRPDHTVPEVFAQLVYTIVSVLAVVRCGVSLHSIGTASLAGNIRWFLEQTWLDDRLRPLFSAGLTAVENSAQADDTPRKDG